MKKQTNNRLTLALDKSSARSFDENGYMHVSASHITKAVVNPYYGSEIPGWEEHGLDADTIYYGYRDPEELKQSLSSWAGLPLHVEHHVDSADDPQKLTRVGAVGTEVVWNAPYVDAPLTIWDGDAIKAVEDGSYRELSCAYRYDPDWTSGEHEGVHYDFIMRHIRGNHVALVEEGRAGPDVLVADSNTVSKANMEGNHMANEDIEKKEVDLAQAIIDLHKVDPNTGEVVDVQEDEDKAAAVRELVAEFADKLEPEQLDKLANALNDLAYSKPDAADEDEPASDEDGETADEDAPDLKAAMDECGLDADNEAVAEAFAKGVEYGKAEEAADEGAEDEDGAEDDDEPVAGAADSKLKRRKVKGMDAASIKRQAVKETRQHMQALFAAVEKVRPLTGSLNAMSFDSANDVYKHALTIKGIKASNYDRSAWRGMVDILLQSNGAFKPVAKDAKPVDFTGEFAGLKNIILS